ncbi:MAG: nicotinate (nicotinamide) nucleotide adenylyltransferase [Verrucomicrobiales bacterium]|nr:nicotinate (nicotinamide) nucleotide adenylyltransferase [Verrucomicrobiales bacterium]
MTRIGLYGGSFDPVHLGHLLVAQAALEELQLDRLFFIPAAQSPFKPTSPPTPGAIRARMLRLALAGWPRTEVDLQELERGGVSYSVDTARQYRGRFPHARLFWLIGTDHVPALPRWRDADVLAELLEFVVIPRPGATPQPAEDRFRIHQLRGFQTAISSSEIRHRVMAGQPIQHLVPTPVGELILRDHLYRADAP